ncbi:lantibiotic dehydratase [Geomicrobium sp. JCM 19055]|uniref:lantibiotic dehydratase n=1 Tax=Geomicrobium sp. JCM 19055 TaxID=1460649 RepID=UPI0005AAF2A4|nr:lantibiotic dehydratase [Geomicrobium sp. JCM 19055]
MILKIFLFLPRVTSNKIILRPAIWKLNKSNIDLFDFDTSFNEWKGKFKEWKMEMNVPDNVHLTFGDNRLFIDLNNDTHLKEVRLELRKKGRIQLQEKINNYKKKLWLYSNDGVHSSEIVVPFKKKDHIEKKAICYFKY